MNPFNEKTLDEFNVRDCESYIKNYPYGEKVSEVKNKLKKLRQDEGDYEEILFSRCSNDSDACKEYVGKYPNGKHIHKVKEYILALDDQEEKLYYDCISSQSISRCSVYVSRYPNGKYVYEIKELLKDLQQSQGGGGEYRTPFEEFINNEIVRYILWGIGAVIIVVIVCAIFGDTSTKTPIMQQLGRWLAKILRLM